MSGWGWFILIIVLLVPVAYFGYIYYRRLQATKAGRAPPPWNPFNRSDANSSSQIYPAPAGVVGWVKNKYYGLRNSRTKSQGGGYEGRRDDDAAGGDWDSRVESGGGGYYEEEELGLAGGHGHHRAQGSSSGFYEEDERRVGGYSAPPSQQGPHQYQYPPPQQQERGRQMDRSLGVEDTAYHGGKSNTASRTRENPFGDTAEASSMRGVSPRPSEGGGAAGGGHRSQRSEASSLKKEGDSPTERRSMFREGEV